MGLRIYRDDYLKRSFKCSISECKEDNSIQQLVYTLSKEDLHAMMHNSKCRLVVDGLWGATDLVFPFPVYKAKKKPISLKAAYNQVYHAYKAYLAMLDDLARNPDNVAEHQIEESTKYQMFALCYIAPSGKFYGIECSQRLCKYRF